MRSRGVSRGAFARVHSSDDLRRARKPEGDRHRCQGRANTRDRSDFETENRSVYRTKRISGSSRESRTELASKHISVGAVRVLHRQGARQMSLDATLLEIL